MLAMRIVMCVATKEQQQSIFMMACVIPIVMYAVMYVQQKNTHTTMTAMQIVMYVVAKEFRPNTYMITSTTGTAMYADMKGKFQKIL
jgi:hypothetical protein